MERFASYLYTFPDPNGQRVYPATLIVNYQAWQSYGYVILSFMTC